MATTTHILPMEQDEIAKHLPHKWPFLWVLRVLELTNDMIVAEIGFPPIIWDMITQGHFPGNPMLLGAFLFEASTQVGALLRTLNPEFEGMAFTLAGADALRWRDPEGQIGVREGDQIIVTVTNCRCKRPFYRGEVLAKKGDDVVFEGIITGTGYLLEEAIPAEETTATTST